MFIKLPTAAAPGEKRRSTVVHGCFDIRKTVTFKKLNLVWRKLLLKVLSH